jgi:hypothetical protein
VTFGSELGNLYLSRCLVMSFKLLGLHSCSVAFETILIYPEGLEEQQIFAH